MKKNFILLSLLSVMIVSSCSKAIESASNDSKEGDGVAYTNASLVSDSLALVALYDALGGEQSNLRNWKTAAIRNWDGVVVGKSNGERRVTELRLGGMRLKGELSPEIKNLTALRVLILAENANLSGSIIDEVYTLKNLEVLSFRFTNLTGELSPKIGDLVKLDTLDLRTSLWVLGGSEYTPNQHRISGSLPAEIGKLTAMRYLNISRHAFSGDLPKEIGLLKALTFMDISDCEFSGAIPAEIGQLQNLVTIFSNDNHFSGALPTAICSMKTLEQLYLANNQLEGEIPANIGDMTKIHEIDFSNNKLTGSVPQSLEKAMNLGILNFSHNALEGAIPSDLGNNFHMVRLYLNNNNLTGSLPNLKFKYMPGVAAPWLCVVDVTNNRLSGAVPATMLHYSDYGKNILPQQSGFGFTNL